MVWAVVGGVVLWVLLAGVLGIVLGRGIRLADARSGASPLDAAAPSSAPGAAPVRPRRAARRRVPLPPVGIALAGLAVGLMTVGYAVRLGGATGPAARVLSMDAPGSLPRLFVAGLFAAAALAAVAGAARAPGRRTWWLSVGAVAAGIASVKAGSTVHAAALAALTASTSAAVALVASGVVAVAVLAVLAFVSRAERRDRRRVLVALTGYAVAAVGLSAVSALSPGGRWAAAATFVEESGEALAGVWLLVAVLVGVAPRLVLPADWALRRRADADGLTVPEAGPGPVTAARRP